MWTSPVESVRIFAPPDEQKSSSRQIAAFDMDHTLITPKDRTKTFPKGRSDWTWWHPSVPGKLRALHESGNQVVIFSNQAVSDVEEVMGKFSDVIRALGIPVIALMSLGHDQYRKPSGGMYGLLVDRCSVPFTSVLYCGDAAGREKGWDGNKKTKKDFSCSDRMFASNIGANTFVTPEEFFLGMKGTDRWEWGAVNPRDLLALPLVVPDVRPANIQEVVVLVGCAASGKSTIAKGIFKDYVRINNDDLGSKAKCMKLAREALLVKKCSIVVDNTNPDVAAREVWIALARECNIKSIRCVCMDTSREIAHHMNVFRERVTGVKRIPEIAYNIYFKKYVEPRLDEGFTEVKHVAFSVIPFEDKSKEWLFLQW